MNRHTVRFAVLAALGATLAASSPAEPGDLIPELANAEDASTIPEVEPGPPASVDALVRARWNAWVTRMVEIGVEEKDLAPVRAQLGRVPAMIGKPQPATYRGYIGEFDLHTPEGRIDTVLSCLWHYRSGDTTYCDLSKMLDPARAARKTGASPVGDVSVVLDASMQYIDLVPVCPDGGFGGGCGHGTRIHAFTGACVQLQPCRRGRPLPDGSVAELHGDTRTAAGEAWAQVALDEHASIASFDRHLAELAALGAPADLLEAARQARADEVRHTALALQLAHRFGADVALGALPAGPPPETELLAVLLDVAEHGCIGETVSAAECAIALEQTTDPAVRAVLEAIVTDESAHAALAWRTLAWGLPQLDDDGRAAVLARFAAATVHPAPPCPAGIGVLGGDEAATARSWALHHVVRPALEALTA